MPKKKTDENKTTKGKAKTSKKAIEAIAPEVEATDAPEIVIDATPEQIEEAKRTTAARREATVAIAPGFMVSLKTAVRGGIEYKRKDLIKAKVTETGSEISRWVTDKKVDDPEEHKRATKARNDINTAIRAVCAKTSFGLLCPLDRFEELKTAIEGAKAIRRAYNKSTATYNVQFWTIIGRISETDEASNLAIASELRDLIEEMQRGVASLDPTAIRDAAARAKQIGAMLDKGTSVKVTAAIEAARVAARQITKRIKKEGEDAATVLADLKLADLESARMAFLDLDGDVKPAGEALPSVNVQRFDSLDIDDEETSNATPSASPTGGDLDLDEPTEQRAASVAFGDFGALEL